MNELVEYLLSNIQLDFSGDLSAEKVRQFLREDDGREARRVLAKLLDDDNVDELLITMADCLKDHVRTGIRPDLVREQLDMFADA